MANPSANQVKIDLSGNLCLNELDCEVHSFEGFNERNTQILGNGLKPFYQHIDETDEQVIYDRNEDKWTVKTDGLKGVYKNGYRVITDASDLKATKIKIEHRSYRTSNPVKRYLRFKQTAGNYQNENLDFVCLQDGNIDVYDEDDINISTIGGEFYDFVTIDRAPLLVTLHTNSGELATDLHFTIIPLTKFSAFPSYDYDVLGLPADTEFVKFSANLCHVYISGTKRNLLIFECETRTLNYIYGVLLDSNNEFVEGYELTGISQQGFKLNPLVEETDGFILNPMFFKYNFKTTTITSVIAKIGNNCEWSAGTFTNITDKNFTDFRNGNTANIFDTSGQVQCEDENLCGLRAFHIIQGIKVSSGDDGKPVVYTQLANFGGYPIISQSYTQQSVLYVTENGKLTSLTEADVNNMNSLKLIFDGYDIKYKTGYNTDLWEDVKGCINIKIRSRYGFNYLINFNGNAHSVTGISTYSTLLTRWGGVDPSVKFIPAREETDYSTALTCQYLSENGDSYKIIIATTVPLKIKYILNRYIVSNIIKYDLTTIHALNAYDIQEGKAFVYADDWNNRLIPENLTTGSTAATTACEFVSFATGRNQIFQVEESANGRTCYFPPLFGYITYNTSNGKNKDQVIEDTLVKTDYNKFVFDLDVFYEYGTSTNAMYQYTLFDGWKKTYNSLLENTMYTVVTSNNMYLSPDLLSDYKQLCNNDWVITSDGNSYILTKYDFENMLLYQIGTLIQDIDDIFSIQGQFYAIKNNTLFLVTISEGIITSNTIIYYLQDLQFIGATLQYALFYSPKQKSVYVFSGDRKLELLGPTNDIDYVNTYFYDNSQNTIFIGCDKFILCYKDNYFWKIHIPEVKQFYFTDRGIEFITDDKIGLIHNYYHADDKAEMSVIPVNLGTAFYGFGENRIGIIDCWNIRLFSKDKLSGNVKLKVTSLTDKGTVGEEATISIKESDWDEVTKTYLLRFQPRLQRGIGLSLAIVSDFELYDLQVSATPDSALQITERRVI